MAGDDLARSMLEMMEMIAPMREALMGYRLQLVTDGWSPEAAERIAEALFIDMMHKAFTT